MAQVGASRFVNKRYSVRVRPPRPRRAPLVASTLRVIVAEDFAAFRRYLCSVLLGRPDIQFVCEVADGLEAVQSAQELQPHLVLLDIGLPGLNGIEAARRIREVAPQTPILFVSQESSADVVRSAFDVGGCGYVVKIDAATDLGAAIDRVLRGERFVGRRFSEDLFADASGAASP